MLVGFRPSLTPGSRQRTRPEVSPGLINGKRSGCQSRARALSHPNARPESQRRGVVSSIVRCGMHFVPSSGRRPSPKGTALQGVTRLVVRCVVSRPCVSSQVAPRVRIVVNPGSPLRRSLEPDTPRDGGRRSVREEARLRAGELQGRERTSRAYLILTVPPASSISFL